MRTRLATAADAAQIAAIYNHEVSNGIATFDMTPRTLGEQVAWLAEHSGAHPCVVAIDDGEAVIGEATDRGGNDGAAGTDAAGDARIAGWAALSPYRSRPAYSTSVEDSVYVHTDYQGQGVGRLLLDEVVRLAEQLGYHAVFARIACEPLATADDADQRGSVVSGSDGGGDAVGSSADAGAQGAASVRLHQNCGFQLVGVERQVGRKFGRWLDVTLMQRLLGN